MKCIFGSVVGRKFQKVSHKIAKVRCTKKEEHIVLENMHEPIIDIETWNKAQDKLNGYTKVRDRKYDHELKGFVYCGECGNKATLRCREEKRKNGTVWRAEYFICSKRNNYSGLCDCKQISANLLQEEVIKQLKKEIAKINLSKEELKQIYEQARLQAKSKENLLNENLKHLKQELKNNEQNIAEIYQDKINKIIQVEDFKIIYEKMQKQRDKILKEIKQNEIALKQNNKEIPKIDFEKIKCIAEEFFKLENPNKIVLEQLIEKIEFDKEKNIKIKFVFQNMVK
ncbi:MAG: recombinase zinc beta ribbon domain-containing protein [Clostridia bacterium]|nr:recombinase zinc beta ribbon domain-containing protein [Clostridia bacterium]